MYYENQWKVSSMGNWNPRMWGEREYRKPISEMIMDIDFQNSMKDTGRKVLIAYLVTFPLVSRIPGNLDFFFIKSTLQH